MKKSNESEKKTWKSRLTVAIAGFALVAAVAGGVSAVDTDPAAEADTTETAWAISYGMSWY